MTPLKIKINSFRSKIEELNSQGYSISEISKILELPYPSLYEYCRDICLPKIKQGTSRTSNSNRTRKLSITKEELENLYIIQKKNLYQLAKQFKVNPVTILNKMNEFGIPRRSKSVAASMIWDDDRRERQRQLANSGKIGVHFHGCGAYRNSSIERIFEEWATTNQIEIQKQFQFEKRMHRYDFWIKGTKILVEVDGMYWHDRPEQKLKDSLQEQEALDRDFFVIRFTDKEIQKTNGNCFAKRLNGIESRRT